MPHNQAEIDALYSRERSALLLILWDALFLTHEWTGAHGLVPSVGSFPDPFVWRGLWASAAVYLIDDAVSFGGASYICILAHVADGTNQPPNVTYWNTLSAKGDTGAAGPQGSQGNQGPPGSDGEPGADGEQGVPGPVGSTGADGAAGVAGAPGPPGQDGEPGVDGADGPPGSQGATGSVGPTGSRGEQGPPGEKGDDGLEGEIGPPGPTGATGPAGGGGGSLTLTTVEINIGSSAHRNGRFLITSSGLTAGKAVLIQQAVGPYTGKGTRVDEAEMDALSVTGKTISTTQIECFWGAPRLVRGNYKFDYAVSA